MDYIDVKNDYNILSLAYLGDSVFELLVRFKLIKSFKAKSGKLNDLSRKYVTATNQSRAMEYISELLTDEEKSLVNRARNSQLNHIPSSASLYEYHNATALECLFGFLYLCEDKKRINTLFDAIFNYLS